MMAFAASLIGFHYFHSKGLSPPGDTQDLKDLHARRGHSQSFKNGFAPDFLIKSGASAIR